MEAAKTALVLGGGGALGWVYHAGVLAALEDDGLDPAEIGLIVGTSAGSAVAAAAKAGTDPAHLIATVAQPPTDEQRQAMLQEVRSAKKSLRPLSWRVARQSVRARGKPVLALSAILPRGLFPTRFAEFFPGVGTHDGWPSGLWIPATRAHDGELVVFGRDRSDVAVADAVAASSAVPAMFQPKVIDGVEYVDGGAHSPTHADLLVGAGFETIVISSPMSRPSGKFLARHARRRLDEEVAALRRAGVNPVVVHPSPALVALADGFPRRNPDAAPAIAAQARVDTAAACRRAGLARGRAG